MGFFYLAYPNYPFQVFPFQFLLKACDYENIIKHCEEELNNNGERSHEAKLLRATFNILCKQQEKAMEDLSDLIQDDKVSVKIRVNALIKRASLFIQQCKDPSKDPELSFKDFTTALELDPENADIYHHRGQVCFHCYYLLSSSLSLSFYSLSLRES